MTIIEAGENEREAWLAMRLALWPQCPPEQSAREISAVLQGGRQGAFLARDAQGAACGFVEVSLRDYVEGCSSSPVGYVEGIYVAPVCRRRGVGRALLQAAEQWAAARGCVDMGSDAALDDGDSAAFHRAAGFRETDRQVVFLKPLAVPTDPAVQSAGGAGGGHKAVYAAEVAWQRGGQVFVDGRYSRRHRLRFDGGLEVPASASPHVVPLPYSDPAAVDPEEAFVAALASCHMLWFLSLAAERGLCIEHYHDAAEGTMAKNAAGKWFMAVVTLRPEVSFAGARPSRQAILELHHAAHAECFIANSVLTEVRCAPRWLAGEEGI